ncbi:MAG: triose-phosphate isomerase [Negativicutes bacterium]|nr:triose-phosphate isomerase [Negativicutes bacterium]
MNNIFVNLKRFEVSRTLGGVCDASSPREWTETVMEEAVRLGLGQMPDTRVVFLLPEALLITAVSRLGQFPPDQTANLSIGCQGVHREDIAVGGNFGAFTSVLPATAAVAIGCEWAIIGHSEERKNMQGIIGHYAGKYANPGPEDISGSVNELLNQEVLRALRAGLKVLYCVGETAEEKGSGTLQEQELRVKELLGKQLDVGLNGAARQMTAGNIVIGYEPIWAIGPGKTPPDSTYIGFVSAFIKAEMMKLYGLEAAVVYGGGLKEENAGTIAAVPSIDGGLVALTRFSGDIGFYPGDLRKIVDNYRRQ